ncbi:hypothetical protein [Parachlamydia acanthamoebae]|uniref:F-box domain-containing protein n=1 Tax=Parachlamydia acanthamoebae TaxID=83552 RepID=A0A0C1E3I7_9BACT|nr:hypothetical protein [Parachlamydia acanthamoebae]KIA76052.1 hypothetical protein DB43_BY00010 [Parachlamydia acanthamoebae]
MPETTIFHLPNEMLTHISSFLDPRSTLAFTGTSQELKGALADERLTLLQTKDRLQRDIANSLQFIEEGSLLLYQASRRKRGHAQTIWHPPLLFI